MSCSKCPVYIATQNDDDTMRKEVAERWSKEFRRSIKREDINCDGCTSRTGVLFNHRYVCEIRKCGLAKSAENCAYCEEYLCEKINEFFKFAPDAKVNLERIRSGL